MPNMCAIVDCSLLEAVGSEWLNADWVVEECVELDALGNTLADEKELVYRCREFISAGDSRNSSNSKLLKKNFNDNGNSENSS